MHDRTADSERALERERDGEGMGEGGREVDSEGSGGHIVSGVINVLVTCRTKIKALHWRSRICPRSSDKTVKRRRLSLPLRFNVHARRYYRAQTWMRSSPLLTRAHSVPGLLNYARSVTKRRIDGNCYLNLALGAATRGYSKFTSIPHARARAHVHNVSATKRNALHRGH